MWGLFGVAVLLAFAVSPFRAEPAAQNPDVSKELLVEVRGLRVAMEQLASAGPRVQLMFGRLQLQEQRINDQGRKLDALRMQLKGAQDQEREKREQIQRFEEFVRTNPGSDEREELERDLPQMRKHLAALTFETQRLLAEEANLSSVISAEQNRWTDINRALDELERALSRR
jgi:predicted  nucleic acid-binding Zn-ribbon protein